VASSVLAAPLLLLGGLWALALWASLWRRLIEEQAADALAGAAALGLTVRPASVRGRVVARGQVGGQDVAVLWLGGVSGLRCRVQVRDGEATAPFLAEASALREALVRYGVAL